MTDRRPRKPGKRYDNPKTLKDLLGLSKVLYEEHLYYESYNKTYGTMNKRIRLEENEMLAAIRKKEEEELEKLR
jgi:hypothetical protein